MSKKNSKAGINLDLLRPQGSPEKIMIRLIRWLLSSGRYIFIFVEGLVLIAFATRFKLDADLESKKEAIEQQIPYIESLKPFEILIRKTQLKLSTIDSMNTSYTDFPQILKMIADQTPSGIKIISINLEKNVTNVIIKLNGQSQSNNDVIVFTSGLKGNPVFSNINITGISFKNGSLNFSLSTQATLTRAEGKSL